MPNLVTLTGPDGALYEGPESGVQAALEAGYRTPTSQELNDFRLEKQYGSGAANTAKAFAAGVPRMVSLGASDSVLTHLGLATPEELQQLKEKHSVASGAGEVAGLAGLAPISPAAGIAGTAESAVAKATGPAVSKVLSTSLAKVSGGAVEGALYGGAGYLQEHHLGDPSFNGEALLHHVGLGAVLGGGLRGTLGAASETLPEASSRITEAFGEGTGTPMSNFLENKVGKTAAGVVKALPGINALSRIEAVSKGVSKAIIAGTKVLAKPGVIESLEPLATFSAEKVESEYNKASERLKELATNPEALLRGSSQAVNGLSEQAPDTAQAMQTTAIRAAEFLGGKLPQTPSAGPLAPELEPSLSQKAQFLRYYHAAQEPLSVLKQAARGDLTHEGIEAISAIYPALYGRIQGELMGHLTAQKTIPYQKRLMLSLIMGHDMDGSTNPRAMRANQTALGIASIEQKQKDNAFLGGPKPTQGGLGKISLSNRIQTPAQLSNMRGRR